MNTKPNNTTVTTNSIQSKEDTTMKKLTLSQLNEQMRANARTTNTNERYLFERYQSLVLEVDGIKSDVKAIDERVSSIEKAIIAKDSKAKTDRKATYDAPKSSTQSREERITEKYGDKDTRVKFIEIRKDAQNEITTQIKARVAKGGKYLTKSQYMAISNSVANAKMKGSKKSIKTLVKEALA